MTLTIIIFSIALLPSLVWLLFYLKEDPPPEPPRWLWLAFFLGIGSAPVSFYLEKWALELASTIGKISTQTVSENILFMFFGIAFVEEVVKFIAARLLLAKNPVFDEPVDAMIYLITIALGFAAFENILILQSSAAAGRLDQAIQTIVLRFIGANFLHTLSSGLIGYYWALGIIERRVPKRLGMGIFLATSLHAGFNLLIINFGAGYLVTTTLLLFIVGLMVIHDFEILKRLKTPATQVRKQL